MSARKDKTGEEPITYEEAKRRLIPTLKYFDYRRPSACAYVIWPHHTMKAQGAAFAVAALLARMRAEGVIRWGWDTTTGRSGWCAPTYKPGRDDK